jgi:PAS domain S-box-containing protein
MPVLECMCGNVIRGRFDPSLPFFTPGGSFWTNSTTALLASTTQKQRQSRTRDRCHGEGYESVALVPLRWGDTNFGLLQFNDPRPGRFSPAEIALLERLAAALTSGLVSRLTVKELCESEEKYRLLVEASLEGILITDHEFRFTYVNEATARMLGYPADYLIGRKVHEFFCEQTSSETDIHLQRRRSGQDEIHERCFRHKDGSSVWVTLSAKALKDEKENFAGSFAMLTDITARKKMEEELRQSEEKYRMIVDTALEGIVVMDRDHRVTFANKAMADMLGIEAQHAIGSRIEDAFYTPADDDISDEHLRRRHEARDEIYERCYRHKNGSPIWAMVSARALLDKEGNFDGAFAMVTDITARKKMEEDLRQSEEHYRTLIKAIPDTMARFDRQLRFISMSDNIEAITGISPASLIGKTHREAGFPEKLCVFWEKEISGVFATGLAAETDFSFNTQQGEKIFNWRLLPEFDEKGLVQSVITMGRDVTEHRRITREYHSLFQKMLDGFALHEIILDDWGKPVDYRFLAVNPAFERLTGLKAEDVVGRRVLEILPDTEKRWIEAYGRVALTGEPAVFEMRHEELGIDFEISAFRPAPMQCANIFINVTDLRRAEKERANLQAQLFQAQKMESVGRLAGGVAHDFNNKLGVIMGHAEMALDSVISSHPLHTHLTEIIKAARLSADLTRQLLTFARKQAISPRVIDLNETIQGMFKMLGRLIGEDIELVHQAGEGLWPVYIDPAQIDQILANLCINARDAIAGKGRITVTTANSSPDAAYCRNFSALQPGEYVCLTVADTGPGMSEEVKERLFEPFFTTKEEGKGTGLGLATVFGAVKQNNGYIYVESEPGRGSTFTIYLPRHTDGRRNDVDEKEPADAPGGTETILIVEDETSILNVLRMLLTRMGYQVLAVPSAEEALLAAAAHKKQIDLLIADVVMPGMNGFELARQIRAERPDMKAMFISGYTPNSISKYGKLDKDVVFIQKPFTKETLAIKVREALGKEGN